MELVHSVVSGFWYAMAIVSLGVSERLPEKMPESWKIRVSQVTV